MTVVPSASSGAYPIPIPVPVLDACRLKLVRVTGGTNLTWTIRWLADQPISALGA